MFLKLRKFFILAYSDLYKMYLPHEVRMLNYSVHDHKITYAMACENSPMSVDDLSTCDIYACEPMIWMEMCLSAI